mmetsp:Transcript_24322/g.47831  ORF Transcript_24322/g.47831 Transcript_24322/m.47831 type:complete len:231 (-) Transcript_24322:157-849(-)
MRLTAELVRDAPSYMNALQQRELGLRGYRIPVIENLGVTQNQYQAMDLSENELIKLDNFPVLTKLESILMSNNRVSRVATGLGKYLPNLDTLVLTNNKISKLSDLNPLSHITSLTSLILVNNPVCKQAGYRLYCIHRLPSLKVLDFQKVKPAEREAAKARFGELNLEEEKEEPEQEAMQDEEEKEDNTFTPGDKVGLTPEERAKIMEQISAATSLEEIERLEKLLAQGSK